MLQANSFRNLITLSFLKNRLVRYSQAVTKVTQKRSLDIQLLCSLQYIDQKMFTLTFEILQIIKYYMSRVLWFQS